MPDHTAPGLAPLPVDDATIIRAEEVPGFIGIARQTLARWRHEGNGPLFVKLGRRVFYRSGDLKAWIEKRTRQNTVSAGVK